MPILKGFLSFFDRHWNSSELKLDKSIRSNVDPQSLDNEHICIANHSIKPIISRKRMFSILIGRTDRQMVTSSASLHSRAYFTIRISARFTLTCVGERRDTDDSVGNGKRELTWHLFPVKEAMHTVLEIETFFTLISSKFVSTKTSHFVSSSHTSATIGTRVGKTRMNTWNQSERSLASSFVSLTCFTEKTRINLITVALSKAIESQVTCPKVSAQTFIAFTQIVLACTTSKA